MQSREMHLLLDGIGNVMRYICHSGLAIARALKPSLSLILVYKAIPESSYLATTSAVCFSKLLVRRKSEGKGSRRVTQMMITKLLEPGLLPPVTQVKADCSAASNRAGSALSLIPVFCVIYLNGRKLLFLPCR